MTRYLTAILLATTLAGCEWIPKWGPRKTGKPVLPDGLTATQVLDHVNANAGRISSWQCLSVNIKPTSAGILPLSLNGKLVVESPKQFRLTAGSSMTGAEFDVGANTSDFWLWIKRTPTKEMLTASHEDLPAVQRALKLPVDPGLLMEALGVKQAQMPNATIEEPADENIYRLSSVIRQPDGKNLRRTIEVSKLSGEVVTQAIANENGVLAVARMSKHKYDDEQKVSIPHRIELYSPAQKQGVTLTMSDIRINPPAIDPELWKMPRYDGYRVVNVGRILRNRREYQPVKPADHNPQPKPLRDYSGKVADKNELGVRRDGFEVKQEGGAPPFPE